MVVIVILVYLIPIRPKINHKLIIAYILGVSTLSIKCQDIDNSTFQI